MKITIAMLALLLVLPMVGCTDKLLTAPSRLASCNDKPPGQQPSGNPAHAPGNSSSLDKDCKNQ